MRTFDFEFVFNNKQQYNALPSFTPEMFIYFKTFRWISQCKFALALNNSDKLLWQFGTPGL